MENKLWLRGCPCCIGNDGQCMSTNVNVDILPILHEEDGSSIVDDGYLPYRIEVEQHDVGKTSQIQREGGCVEAFSFPSSANMGLNRLYREHFVFKRSEVMVYVSMSKNIINVPHFKIELMASNPTV